MVMEISFRITQNSEYQSTGTVDPAYTYTNFSGPVSATSLTTLCRDGYPRVIGDGSYLAISTTTVPHGTYTVTTTAPRSFTTPMPCSINPSDCANLWRSFASATSVSLVFANTSFPEPPCALTGTSVPFEAVACVNTLGEGYSSGIIASSIELLYWPVRTASHFCTRTTFDITAKVTVSGRDTFRPTIEVTPTGPPATFVADGLTITSPTVALSFSALRRGDGCGPTIEHTILPIPPEQLSSVRGARVGYFQEPFEFADLNWMCESPNGTFTVQDSNGENCYQDVQGDAYWWASPQADWSRGDRTKMTILNNYKPYVVPDPKFATDELYKLWGTSAFWWVDGVFDPPIALTQASDAAGPTLPGDYPALTAAPTGLVASSTAASPANTITAMTEPTAQADELNNNDRQSTRPEASLQQGNHPITGIGGFIASGLGTIQESSSSAAFVSSMDLASMESLSLPTGTGLTASGVGVGASSQQATSPPDQSTASKDSTTSLGSLSPSVVSIPISTVESGSSAVIQGTENTSTRNSCITVLALWLAGSSPQSWGLVVVAEKSLSSSLLATRYASQRPASRFLARCPRKDGGQIFQYPSSSNGTTRNLSAKLMNSSTHATRNIRIAIFTRELDPSTAFTPLNTLSTTTTSTKMPTGCTQKNPPILPLNSQAPFPSGPNGSGGTKPIWVNPLNQKALAQIIAYLASPPLFNRNFLAKPLPGSETACLIC
ncbi:hypothetical protein Slin15195_G118130 [Septoria linicola]|uniref:Uncharacterized protein n=1 Tax=Septoria linicola TaxID=215465 RepID=A0A9Q9B089_9PEZI|nr:hypothetical protein Slin14017_G095130 [Septoria linicola]USW58494.1 hypothetical protein Slin15195_G118130 [Septoria linicola]